MINKKIILGLTSIICVMVLASCGTNTPNKDNSSVDSSSINNENTNTESFDARSLSREEMLLNIRNACISLNDAYEVYGDCDGTIYYTVKNAALYTSLSDAGITYDDLDITDKTLSAFYFENPENCVLTTADNFFKENKNDLADGCYFLMLDFDVENVDAKTLDTRYPEYNMRADSVGCILDASTNYDSTFATFNAAYFDLHDQTNEGIYFMYEIKPGERKSFKMGYLVKPSDVSMLYLTDLKSGVYFPSSPYVDLGLSEKID